MTANLNLVTFDLHKTRCSYLVCILNGSNACLWHQRWPLFDLDHVTPMGHAVNEYIFNLVLLTFWKQCVRVSAFVRACAHVYVFSINREQLYLLTRLFGCVLFLPVCVRVCSYVYVCNIIIRQSFNVSKNCIKRPCTHNVPLNHVFAT